MMLLFVHFCVATTGYVYVTSQFCMHNYWSNCHYSHALPCAPLPNDSGFGTLSIRLHPRCA